MNFLRPKEERWLLTLPKPLLDDIIIRVPLMTGLSPIELVTLNVEDIYYEWKVIFVWRSKTSTDHLSKVDTETLLSLYEFTKRRTRGPLLQWEGTPRTKVQRIRRTVKKYAKEVGIARWKHITPYTLRHTFAIKWVLGRGTLEGLRRQLGLRSLQKLKHYLDFDYSYVEEEYVRIFEQTLELTRAHWRAAAVAPYIV